MKKEITNKVGYIYKITSPNGKISIGLIGNKNGIGNKGRFKKIICINNNKIYDSIKNAVDKLHLHGNSIIRVCKGTLKQTKGYKFKYYEEKDCIFNGGGD